MQDMIRRIVDADNEAKALEESNRRAAEQQKLKIEEDAKKIYEKYMKEAEAEIVKNNTYLEKRFARKLSDVTAKQESAQIKLRSDFEQNRDKWVNEIVSRVLAE